jgi:hypothetical protein
MKTINSATSKRKTTLILIVIAFLLVSAIVYAALNGVLTISGTTTTLSHTDVIFKNVTALSGSGYNVEPDFEVSADGHSITFSTDLTDPGQKSGIQYEMEVLGSSNVRIYAPTIDYDEDMLYLKTGVDYVLPANAKNKIFLHDSFYQQHMEAANYGREMQFASSQRFIAPDGRGGTDLSVIRAQSTADYITVPPGSTGEGLRTYFEWRTGEKALPAGDYEVTLTMNFEAAT